MHTPSRKPLLVFVGAVVVVLGVVVGAGVLAGKVHGDNGASPEFFPDRGSATPSSSPAPPPPDEITVTTIVRDTAAAWGVPAPHVAYTDDPSDLTVVGARDPALLRVAVVKSNATSCDELSASSDSAGGSSDRDSVLRLLDTTGNFDSGDSPSDSPGAGLHRSRQRDRNVRIHRISPDQNGCYLPERRTAVAAVHGLDAEGRLVVAHETTHALADLQVPSFDHTLPADDDFDAGEALHAVGEGQAVLGEELYAKHVGGAIVKVVADDMAARKNSLDDDTDTDPSVTADYWFGYLWAKARSDDGADPSAVFASLAHPPVSTVQILHPELPTDFHPTAVQAPGAASLFGNGSEEFQGTFGAIGLGAVLNGFEKPTADEAYKVVGGWRGDRFQLAETDSGEVLALRTVWDTPADAREFVDTFNAYCRIGEGEVCESSVYLAAAATGTHTLLLGADDLTDLATMQAKLVP